MPDMSVEAEKLRAIARAGNNGYYSGGVDALRAVWKAGQDDAASKIASLLEDNAGLIQGFAGDRTAELIAHLVRTLAPIGDARSGDA